VNHQVERRVLQLDRHQGAGRVGRGLHDQLLDAAHADGLPRALHLLVLLTVGVEQGIKILVEVRVAVAGATADRSQQKQDQNLRSPSSEVRGGSSLAAHTAPTHTPLPRRVASQRSSQEDLANTDVATIAERLHIEVILLAALGYVDLAHPVAAQNGEDLVALHHGVAFTRELDPDRLELNAFRMFSSPSCV
jgi:hypothetical protein